MDIEKIVRSYRENFGKTACKRRNFKVLRKPFNKIRSNHRLTLGKSENTSRN